MRGEKASPLPGSPDASIIPYNSQNISERESLVTIIGTFHSHPSGTATIANPLPEPGTTSLMNNSPTYEFTQEVHDNDITNAGTNENRSDKYQLKGNSYVLAAKDQQVHIYNSSGVKASISFFQFRNIGKR
jgi:hypothetical protein